MSGIFQQARSVVKTGLIVEKGRTGT